MPADGKRSLVIDNNIHHQSLSIKKFLEIQYATSG